VKRVLILSPHFPPDSGAASHRMRLLAPRLPEYGWLPTVVAVDPRNIGGPTEPALAGLIHGSVRIDRVTALGGAKRRLLGVGDVGLRSLRSLYRRSRELLREDRYSAILITLPPHYTALLGPLLGRASGLPYVLDYQDPWVSAWGLTVGGGQGGRPDWKSRLSRWIAIALEPLAVGQAAGLSAVSEATLEGLLVRKPALRALPRAEIPLGGEPLDFEHARSNPQVNRFFDPRDGRLHVAYVGTLPPSGGRGVMAAFFAGLALLLERSPDLRPLLRFHFLGTSMRSAGDPLPIARPIAEAAGVGDCVAEHPLRIDYVDTLSVLTQARAVLLLGGTEPHYTASRVYPAILSGAPLLAVYHAASTVCEVLRHQGPPERTHLVTFNEHTNPGTIAEGVAQGLAAVLVASGSTDPAAPAPSLGDWSASVLAGRMADCLDRAVAQERPVVGARA
jgi:hypothetical protein